MEETEDITKPDKLKTTQKNKNERIKSFTRIIIRNLPPSMIEKDFLEQIDPVPEYDSFNFCLPDWSLGQDARCRAYFSFKNPDDIYIFRDRFDGYVFLDWKGVEYITMVEYAPFQGFHKKKSRNKDNKVNTIELEPHYQKFIENLQKKYEEETLPDLKSDFTLERKNTENDVSTPLLQYLASKKEKRREDTKKKYEEKKKIREEEIRLLQAKTQNKCKAVEKPNKIKDGVVPSENKNARAKRRAGRDQRRREEHEQRRKALEQHDELRAQQSIKLDTTDNQEITLLQKEQKAGEIIKIQSSEPDTEKACTSAMEINLSNSSTHSHNMELQDKIKNMDNNTTDIGSKPPQKDETFIRSKSKIASEERRIKNKDRPSIAIYQPKARLLSMCKDDVVKVASNTSTIDNEDSKLDIHSKKKDTNILEKQFEGNEKANTNQS